jgi:hypothetical protein
MPKIDFDGKSTHLLRAAISECYRRLLAASIVCEKGKLNSI